MTWTYFIWSQMHACANLAIMFRLDGLASGVFHYEFMALHTLCGYCLNMHKDINMVHKYHCNKTSLQN